MTKIQLRIFWRGRPWVVPFSTTSLGLNGLAESCSLKATLDFLMPTRHQGWSWSILWAAPIQGDEGRPKSACGTKGIHRRQNDFSKWVVHGAALWQRLPCHSKRVAGRTERTWTEGREGRPQESQLQSHDCREIKSEILIATEYCQ